MKLSYVQENPPILSNVGEVGEFRIRNSAKAFNILSSGLYANKIRAIIRELSTNAVDSHVAAGRGELPFDVHLPNKLEPWFSIRDYGTGLSHDQVTNIYTTYFESTKTDSNDFIGTLGLGSKSPFSYTDNFTVTAIKDGRKGIYTAFINDAGVPSIALMMEENTTDPAGVEVKFSVNENEDFNRFCTEATYVYRYFKLRPVVTGYSGFEFRDVQYETKDIIPGVHALSSKHSYAYNREKSVAVMGNMAYPIDIPSSDKTIGPLAKLLECGLEIHFEIGELDIQASREGLSYIPLTVNSIKSKLEALNQRLDEYLKEETDKIDNLWKRSYFLKSKLYHPLWMTAAAKYIKDTNIPTISTDRYHSTSITVTCDDLATKYNIKLQSYSMQNHYKSLRTSKPISNYTTPNELKWLISIDPTTLFVTSDVARGTVNRIGYHFKNHPDHKSKNYTFFVLFPADSSKPMDTVKFFADVFNPPSTQMFKASDLDKKPTSTIRGESVSILMLDQVTRGRTRNIVWTKAGTFAQFNDPNKTYYYVPLAGYQIVSKFGETTVKDLYYDIRCCNSIPGFSSLTIYGVRKSELELVQAYKNWVNAEDFIAKSLRSITDLQKLSLAAAELDSLDYIDYDAFIVKNITNRDSPYVKIVEKLKGKKRIDKYEVVSFKKLCKTYLKDDKTSPMDDIKTLVDEAATVYKRYPLLKYLNCGVERLEVAKYINLIDTQEGI